MSDGDVTELGQILRRALRIIDAMPDEPPQLERDCDHLEAVMGGDPGRAWTCVALADFAGVPRQRATAALRALEQRGAVVASGRTKGRRYHLQGPDSGQEHDPWPTGI